MGERFGQLWEATQPPEVPAEAWDRVWAGIEAGLSTRDAHDPGTRSVLPAHRSAPPSRWRTAAVLGLVGLAQAAALLLAVGLAWRTPAKDGGPVPGPSAPAPAPAVAVAPSLDSEFDFEDGQVPLLRSDGSTVRMVDLTDLDSANGEDPWFVFFNRVEATGAVVAMAE
jgi:hypothetical protein